MTYTLFGSTYTFLTLEWLWLIALLLLLWLPLAARITPRPVVGAVVSPQREHVGVETGAVSRG